MEKEATKKRQLSIKISDELYAALWEESHKRETPTNKVTVSDVVNEALTEYIEKKQCTVQK